MKKILMTWYGITDLRSSLSIDYTNGPVFSALSSEDYDEVIILGYTNKEKKVNNDEFIKDLEIAKINFQDNNQSELWKFINKYSNTPIAHQNFINWLQSLLDKTIKINFQEVFLRELNDTENIYEYANKALDNVIQQNNIEEITFYLSPGTPVMAFVWAFVALRYPNIKKRLIASPIINQPPQVVSLPNEWLEWHSKNISTDGSHIKAFDIVFHLFGEQRMPSFLGIKQFNSKKHVFINSEKYPAKVMKKFLDGAAFDEIKTNPFSAIDVKEKIESYINKLPKNYKIGFNLTGGTKLMYAGAMAVCKKINAIPFYFDAIHNKMIFLDDFSTEETKNITNVETFIQLHRNDLEISNKGKWNDIKDINNPNRTLLTKTLWKYKSQISHLYGKILEFEKKGLNYPFELKKGKIYINFDKNQNVEISLDSHIFYFNKWHNFHKYITGGWFEEYIYLQLEPLLREGKILDMRIGMEISFKEKTNQITKKLGLENLRYLKNGDPYQELDIVFTNGKQLYIVECKAGNIKSDYIMKLQNIIRFFGGIESKGILAACFAPHDKIVQKKIKDAKNLKLLTKNFRNQIVQIL